MEHRKGGQAGGGREGGREGRWGMVVVYFSIIGSIMTHSHANEIHMERLRSDRLPPQSHLDPAQ